jgi:uncharacterized protein
MPTPHGPATDAEVAAWAESLGVPGIVDLHVHFMPDTVQQKVWSFFDKVSDLGAPPWPITYRTSEQERVETLRALGVKAFTTLNYAHRPGMARWLNGYSADLAASCPDAIHSATLYPEPGVETVVGDALSVGARVFKVHLQVGGFSPLDPRLTDAWVLLEQARTPVVIHCGNGPHPGEHTGIGPVRDLVDRHPDLVLVIAHAGLPEYREFAGLAAAHPHVYLDTTMVGTSYMEQIAPIPADYPEVLAALPGKVVLGTDFPTIPYPYSHQLRALAGWGLGDAWLADIVWNTPNDLLAGRRAP